MSDSSVLYLFAFGGAALFGLQGSLSLAARHNLARGQKKNSVCDRIARSKEAFIGKIPVAYGAVLFYSIILAQLLYALNGGEIQIFYLNAAMIVAFTVTCYYAYLSFYKLRLICGGCLRIYLANILMVAALSGYHLH